MNELPIEIHEDSAGAVTTFRVSGEIDLETGEALRRYVLEATRRDRQVVVDLSGVSFLDSAGLSELLLTHRALGERSATMVLAGARRMVRELLAITRLDTVFTVVDDPAEAIGGAPV